MILFDPTLQLAVYWPLSVLLLAVALCDLRWMKIPNGLVVAMVMLFAISLTTVSGEWAEQGWRVLTACAVFALGSLGFAFRIVGGGDVKALSALMLFVPTAWLGLFCLLLSVSLIAGVVAVWLLRAAAGRPGSGWAVLRDARRFPMGISIAAAGVALPHATAVYAGI